MERGAYVWCNDDSGDEAWLLAEVIKKSDDELELEVVDNREKRFTRKADVRDEETGEVKFKGVELANAKLSDEDREEGRDDDLITLPHLHEPAILHSISERFFYGKIYTWTGPVLIAVNPFQRLPLYTNEILESYRQEGLFKSQGMNTPGEELGPHVFAVADRSYRQMMREQRKSQSILISGESGAGKTESTKIVMSYLTTLGSMGVEESEDPNEMSTMDKVLQSNPVLEAFGNARTLRNDNSSRFGKFIELGFSRGGHLLGAKVQTYLLEKVRLAFHASGERNYHIFYQILRGCSEEERQKYDFHSGDTGGLELPMYFHFTGQGGAPHLREFTDESGLEYTLKAMKKLGWSPETIDSVLSLCAGILHLGQIKFNKVTDEVTQMDAAEIEDEKILASSARLLGVDYDKMKVALTERIMVARGEEIRSRLEPDKAVDARDALAKTIYGALFLWVVDQVNHCISWERDEDIRSSVGVLDIFGFECFAVNSFEQLCINFTNEALQQQFNKFIFKLEQAEYTEEAIEWAFISFPDNQDCLDTIQMPKTGILSMLDDECRLPKGSDRNWCKRMCDQYLPNKNQIESDNTRFLATNVQKAKAIFCVRHFAGVVEYRAETNFMEKNKDEIPLTAQNLFETAPSQLIKDTYGIQKREMEDRAANPKPGKRAAAKTVGMQFKQQLHNLISNVEKTDPHYIRCLKPNDAAKPKMCTRKRLTEQLRYGGVLEAVRVARAGYPVRMYHEQFFQRYRMLLPTIPESTLPWSMEGRDAQNLCVQLLAVALSEGEKQLKATANGPLDPKEPGISRFEKIRRMQSQPKPMQFPKSDVQLGKTKVFMRKPPHDALEAHRVFHQHASASMIQCWVRGLEAKKAYYTVQDAVQMIQRFQRGCKGRERWWRLRRAAAGHLLTVSFRMLINWRRYQRARKGSIRYQACYRGYMARKARAAIKAQKFFRMHSAQFKYKRYKSAMLALQCAARERAAKKILDELKREQKDVGKLKQNNEKLKQEMASLRAMLAAQAKEGSAKAENAIALQLKQDEIEKLEKRVAELEKELSDAKAMVEQLEKKMELQGQQAEKDKRQLSEYHRLSHTNFGDDPASPKPKSPARLAHQRSSSRDDSFLSNPLMQLPTLGAVSPEMVNEQRAQVIKLEEELDAERKLRREADGEIIKLRAAINGVKLNDSEVDALLAQTLKAPGGTAAAAAAGAGAKAAEGAPQGKLSRVAPEAAPEVTGTEPDTPKRSFLMKSKQKDKPTRDFEKRDSAKVRPAMPSKDKRQSFLRATADFLPKIRRGLGNQEEKEEVVSAGWKVEVRTRKQREETLRDDVHEFEGKMKVFNHMLEEGVEVVMWQLNRTVDMGTEEADDFALKASNVTMRMHRRGDLHVQSDITFTLRGGYLSKAIGRNRGVDKTALEPLNIHEILEVKAGCSGYDHTELPTASGKTPSQKSKTKSKKGGGKVQGENRQSSLFLTLKATPTPTANSRSYILRFKSRSSRNDIMHGLRSVLADMQITEGVSISGLHFNKEAEMEAEKIMVPLSAVNQVINKERQNYDRILLMLWQGFEDLKEKEDELLGLRSKLEKVVEESTEKDRVQANDSKLIMQLSKKLETLLMESEDLRDQNDRLNNRLVAVECEKMNLMSKG